MKHRFIVLLLLVVVVASLCAPVVVTAQEPKPIEERVSYLESRVGWLDYKVRSFASEGMVLFLFGAFCALWAQHTQRSPWLWFFLGLFFSVITVIVLLAWIFARGDRVTR